MGVLGVARFGEQKSNDKGLSEKVACVRTLEGRHVDI